MNGHRERLRQRFSQGEWLEDKDLLELLLTFAVPRRDVAPIAGKLVAHFGGLQKVLQASDEALESFDGVGPNSSTLIKLVYHIQERDVHEMPQGHERTLWSDGDEDRQPEQAQADSRERLLRVIGNDEIASALQFLPKALEAQSIDAFKAQLQNSLPYNSLTTRRRRALYLLDRFFPTDRIDTPLSYYASVCSSLDDLRPAVFYQMLRAEPLAVRVAEEVVWPAVPRGVVAREAIRDCVLRYLPDIKPSSLKKTLRSILNTYALLGVATEQNGALHLSIHPGTTEGFLYVLTAEFAEAGMYEFGDLDAGPMRRWLLWDQDWMHRQLYLLRERGIISKVSEIDSMRQFTLSYGQREALLRYFGSP